MARPPSSTRCSVRAGRSPLTRPRAWPTASWTPATWSGRRGSRSSPRTPRSTTPAPRPRASRWSSTSSTPPATPTSAVRSSAACRWSTASCCSSTPPRARCPRPASCSARRSTPACRSSWWSTRPTAATPGSPRSSTRPTSSSWTCSTTPTARTRSTSRSSTPPARPASPPSPHPATASCLRATAWSRCSRRSWSTIPAPEYDEGAPLQAHVTNLDASPFLGRLALLRIRQGNLKKGQTVAWMRRDGSVKNVKITELLVTEGLERQPGESAGPGDIVAVAGIPEITIGETLADPENPVALPLIHVDEPAISMTIGTNTSPLVGRVKGSKVTARLVKDRLDSRADRQRLAPRAPHRAPRRLGGAGPRRAGAGDPGRADAPRGLRAHRRQAAGGHQGGRRQGARAVRAPDHRRARRSTSARSPSCSPPARAGWRA